MATNVTRLTDTGNLLVNGTFDEFTGAPVIDSNVILWVDAGQTSSYSGTGNTWTNLANASLNTTLVNSPTFNTSGWLTFNGTTQYANTGLPGATTFTTDSDFSIACWIKFTDYNPAASSIGTLVGAFNYQGYGLYWNGTPTTYTIGSYMRYVGTVSNNVSSAVTPGNWYYAVQSYSRSGNFHRLYLNGALSKSTTTISGAYNTNLNSVSIGIGYGVGSNGTPGGGTPGTPLNGSVSQVMIYNRALTAAEVLQNYNALAGRYGLAANTSGTAIQRTTTDTVLAEQFDEVTYNTASPIIINQFTYTENFDNVAWAKGGTAITANAVVAPNTTTTADKFNLTAATSQFYLAQDTSLTSGVTYTQSIYAKAGEQTILQITPSTGFTYGTNYVNFNLSTGAIQTQVGSDVATITSAGDGWYRCTYTQAATTTIAGRMLFVLTGGNAGRLPTFAGSANSGVYIWGAQITASSVPEIYQPIAAANTLVSTGIAQKVSSGGTVYLSGLFDEVTGF